MGKAVFGFISFHVMLVFRSPEFCLAKRKTGPEQHGSDHPVGVALQQNLDSLNGSGVHKATPDTKLGTDSTKN